MVGGALATGSGELLSGVGARRLVEGPAVAWFWSPDGERLLYSIPVVEEGETMVKWWVYENGASEELASFVPSAIFGRQYLAFFDQLARSVSFWSPDSTAFVFAGGRPRPHDEDNELSDFGSGLADRFQHRRGIWVQLVGQHEPARIADGLVAVWSPN